MGENAIVYLIITILCAIYAVFIFFGKGPFLSVSYFVMDKEKRKKMKTKEECHFLSMLFTGIAVLTGLMVIGEITAFEWITNVVVIWALVLVIFMFIHSSRKGRKE